MPVVKKATGQIGAQGKVSFGVTPVALKATTQLKCVDGVPKKGGPRPGADPKAGGGSPFIKGAKQGRLAQPTTVRPWRCA